MDSGGPVIPRSWPVAYPPHMTSPVPRWDPGEPQPPVATGLETLNRTLDALPLDPVIRQRLRGVRSINDALRGVLDVRPELELLPLELLAQILRSRPELVPACRGL